MKKTPDNQKEVAARLRDVLQRMDPKTAAKVRAGWQKHGLLPGGHG